MLEANVTFHRSFTVGPVPRRLFGSFIEHHSPRPQEGQLTVDVPPASWHLLRYFDRAA